MRGVFGLAPGEDFACGLVEGLVARFGDGLPHELGQTVVLVNSQRMARAIRSAFDAGAPGFVPRLMLVTDAGRLLPAFAPAVAAAPLRRRLELARAVGQLLERQPDLAARAAAFDLADSLAALFDEMSGEGVDPAVLDGLDVSDQSGHWERARLFIRGVREIVGGVDAPDDAAAVLRADVLALAQHWRHSPPAYPVIVAGSTGSRGTTYELMRAVAALPRGAVVLPGYDFAMPAEAWAALEDPLRTQDHPQYRYARLVADLGLSPQDVARWTSPEAEPPRIAARNRLLSLALRPAPVTDCWLREGPALEGLPEATADLTVLLAPSPRLEALSIALRLRKAVHDRESAALITPDRVLSRQVSAFLTDWGIAPDDSAGMPLHLSAPGRFWRHVGALFSARPDRADTINLLVLLKHPLTHSARERGAHLLHTREFELFLRGREIPFCSADTLDAFAGHRPEAVAWVGWVKELLFAEELWPDMSGRYPLSRWLALHETLAQRLVLGVDEEDAPEMAEVNAAQGETALPLWRGEDGRTLRELLTALGAAAEAAGAVNAYDYKALIEALLAQGEVRSVEVGHPLLRILGTLEARVGGHDLVILAGLNEGVWPAMPTPDPWLNRTMRLNAGLLLPDRQVGLSAHDFQQGVGAREVWLSRSVRSEDAQTVPSRWLNRLLNLLNGLPTQGGEELVEEMVARGESWVKLARRLEQVAPVESAPRPSPRPPVAMRPARLSVTEIRTLIRDPYAIYARHVLKLRPLNPLRVLPTQRLRGIALHEVLERFMRAEIAPDGGDAYERLQVLCEEVMGEQVPWEATRLGWQARFAAVSEVFLQQETARQQRAVFGDAELRGRLQMSAPDFTLTGTADRIDIASGALFLYDYKSGALPGKMALSEYDKQLPLLAAMARGGAFAELGVREVAGVAYIGVGSDGGEKPVELPEPEAFLEQFRTLLRRYTDESLGYTARRALHDPDAFGEYDHLARFGEWDLWDLPEEAPSQGEVTP